MKKSKVFGPLAACALCAGIMCGGAGCKKEKSQNTQTGQKTPVTIKYAQEGRVTFVDAKGVTETLLPLPSGSSCTGSAEGKTTYRQDSCSFPPVNAKIGGDDVTIYWTSPSGSARRNGDDVTLTRNLALRVVKSGADGYDCTSSGAQEFTASTRVNTRGSEKVSFRPARDISKINFESSQTCTDAARTKFIDTLALIRDIEELINVACW